MIARVAVFRPVDRSFDYAVPQPLRSLVGPGSRVWAPWGPRSVEGVVLALDPPDPIARPRELTGVIDAPPVPPDLLSLATWIAEYYLAPPGEVMRLLLPAGGRARARRRVLLTDRGRALAAGLGAALEPLALAELDPRARAVLGSLSERTEAGMAEKDVKDALGLRVLLAAGLAQIDEAVRARTGRSEVWLRLGRAAAEDELTRAPRRAEVLALVVAAGELSLAALRLKDPRAGAHVAILVEAGLLMEERREVSSDPFGERLDASEVQPVLTAAQTQALAAIDPLVRAGEHAPFLLHGITGSGKTEVYLRAIATALEAGRTALVLVPEISLTPQLAARFRGRFGGKVAVLHSALSDNERQDAWRRLRRGEVPIALGARSAVFAPLERLGVVVVDEEHDSSFKQEEGVRYHARDVALMRARAAGAVVLLGSATPSLEAFEAARQGRLRLVELPERATGHPLPPVEIIDLRQHRLGRASVLSAPLEQALAETLARGEQAILFLNRRGFSTFILCKACGSPFRCRDCSVTLTYHRAADRLVCHYCGYQTAAPRRCPSCSADAIDRLGYGTEQVEAQVKARFADARVARLDRDTAQGDGLGRVLDGLRSGELDIVVGTQMITKGHDFPGVTLVGVVLADHGMGLPDFRASERTFQLLEQVAGRAGRGERAGRVIVQTYSPEHVAVACARDHAYLRFVEAELEARRELGYPPYVRLACVRVDGADPQAVRSVAEVAAEAARRASAGSGDPEATVLGPAEAPLGRLKGRTRWQLFIKALKVRPLRAITRAALEVAVPSGVRTSVDVDPMSML